MKTKEQIINKCVGNAIHKHYGILQSHYWEIIIRKAFNKGVKYATRWIPVEEQLPERKFELSSEKVLVKTEKGEIHLSYFDFDSNTFTLLLEQGKVTHWRPINVSL
jgi:hypothetical protein